MDAHERDEMQTITDRDEAQDAIQRLHIMAGGDGEYSNLVGVQEMCEEIEARLHDATKITPEMIEAGAAALPVLGLDIPYETYKYITERVLKAALGVET